MQHSEVLAKLREYIAEEVLDGCAEGLEPFSPLLEWGVINSMEIVRLVNFIKTNFAVEMTNEVIVAENFRDLDAITELVLRQSNR